MCELIAGYTRGNCASIGGVKSVVIYNLENRASYTRSSNEITDLTMEDTKKGFKFTVDKESSSFTETQTRNRENNSLYYDITGSLMIKDMEDATTDLIALIGGGFLGVIVELENGKYYHYGLVNGLTVETSEIATGQAYEDMSGTTINFTGREVAKAPYLASSIYDAIQIPAS